MKLFIGGCHQGKAAYAAERTGLQAVACTPEEALSAPAINQFHLTIRTLLEQGGDPEEYARTLLARNPDAVVISDEVGLGVVPVDPFERRWREAVGRALCILAASAQQVERISCGLGQRLK